MTIGAVFAIGMRWEARSSTALTASPSLPGVTVSANPARNTCRLSAVLTVVTPTLRR